MRQPTFCFTLKILFIYFSDMWSYGYDFLLAFWQIWCPKFDFWSGAERKFYLKICHFSHTIISKRGTFLWHQFNSCSTSRKQQLQHQDNPSRLLSIPHKIHFGKCVKEREWRMKKRAIDNEHQKSNHYRCANKGYYSQVSFHALRNRF